MATSTRKRADGRASYDRILDAAAEIAGERGYRGASISAVSQRSGLPPSSIYWHFANKDELIAAVIDRGYHRWLAALAEPPPGAGGEPSDDLRTVLLRVGTTLDRFGDFLRLGLLLILDRSPDEPTARARFLEVRHQARAQARALCSDAFPGLDDHQVDRLATLLIVLADGVSIARDADGLAIDDAFDLMATAVVGAAEAMRTATP